MVWVQQEKITMSYRTIRILERVQWVSLYAAIAATVVVAILVVLTFAAAIGVDLIGWE
jgi:hypothetical protein